MPVHQLSQCRTLLFLPASNPRAIEKARTLDADMVILDLEDAVREEDKGAARSAAIDAARTGFDGRLTAIRINPVGSRHHGEDMVAARRSGAPFVVLPKVETVRDLADTRSVSEHPVLAMIETPAGVLEAPAIAKHASALIAGTNDLAAALQLPARAARAGLTTALQQIVLAARAAGVPAFDGVFNALDDEPGLVAEVQEGRMFGFDGKSVIHPSQIGTVNRLFVPGEEEIAAAEALVAATTGGAERYGHRMIEAMHVAQARATLAKARR